MRKLIAEKTSSLAGLVACPSPTPERPLGDITHLTYEPKEH